MSMKHERVENLTFYLYLVCVVYICKEEDLPSLSSSYGYSLIGGKILIGKSIVFNIQNHESMDPYSIFIHVLFGKTKYMIMSPEELYYVSFIIKKDLPFTISKFKRSYLIFFVDSRPRADESS